MEIEQKCPIWGTKADVECQSGDFYVEINSPRAGGKYKIKFYESPLNILEGFKKKLADNQRVKVTDWLIEKREKEEDIPEIPLEISEILKDRTEKRIQERIDNLMLFLAKRYEIGHPVETQKGDAIMMLAAHSSSLTPTEVFGFLRHCVSKGYLEELKAKGVSAYRIRGRFNNPQGNVFPPSGDIDLQVNETGKVYHMTVAGKMYAEGISKKEK